MGSTSNPLTGSGWGNQPPGVANPGSGGGGSSFGSNLGMLGFGDPQGLFGLFGGGNNSPNPQSSPMSAGGPWGNPGGYQNPWGANEIQRNSALNNIIAGQYKNQLAPQWEQMFQQGGQNAMNFYNQLMNQGSPYYQQKQQQAFTQGVGENQNAQAQAMQQLRSQGYGGTPSGATAAMIGGMEQQGSQNLAEQYLQNLFQNEQMQLQGAQGLQQTSAQFNPSQLLSGTSIGGNVNIPSNFFQNMANMGTAVQGMMPAAAALGGMM